VRSYLSKEVIKMLEKDGWYEVRCVGSHPQFKHNSKKETTTVKDLQKVYL